MTIETKHADERYSAGRTGTDERGNPMAGKVHKTIGILGVAALLLAILGGCASAPPPPPQQQDMNEPIAQGIPDISGLWVAYSGGNNELVLHWGSKIVRMKRVPYSLLPWLLAHGAK